MDTMTGLYLLLAFLFGGLLCTAALYHQVRRGKDCHALFDEVARLHANLADGLDKSGVPDIAIRVRAELEELKGRWRKRRKQDD